VCAGRAGSHKQRSRPFPISNPTFPLPALWSSCITAGFKCGRQSATLLNWDPTRRRLGLLTSLRKPRQLPHGLGASGNRCRGLFFLRLTRTRAHTAGPPCGTATLAFVGVGAGHIRLRSLRTQCRPWEGRRVLGRQATGVPIHLGQVVV